MPVPDHLIDEANAFTTLRSAVERFMADIDADLCCQVCEPSRPGAHRDNCAVLRLLDALDATPATSRKQGGDS